MRKEFIWTFAAVSNIVFGGYNTKCFIKYWKIKDYGALRRRLPWTYYRCLVLSSCALAMFHTFISTNLSIIPYIYTVDNAFSYIQNIIFHLSTLTMIVLTSMRFWLIHFDINVRIWQDRSSLATLINPATEPTWYIKSKETWGSGKWLVPRVAAPIWFIMAAVCAIDAGHTDVTGDFKIGQTWLTATFISFVSVSFLSLFKLPVFVDENGIIKEIKSTILVAFLFVFAWCAIYYVDFGEIESENVQISIRHFLHIVCAQMFMFSQPVIMETVMRNIEKKKAKYLSIDHVKNLKIISNADFLLSILENDPCIIAYYAFATSEYAQENVLFMIEMLQWLQLQMRANAIKKNWFAPIDDSLMSLTFAESIALSEINANMETNWFEKFKLIHAKYISNDAGLQVNMPHHIFKQAEDFIASYEIKKTIVKGTYKPKLVKKSGSPTTTTNVTSLWADLPFDSEHIEIDIELQMSENKQQRREHSIQISMENAIKLNEAEEEGDEKTDGMRTNDAITPLSTPMNSFVRLGTDAYKIRKNILKLAVDTNLGINDDEKSNASASKSKSKSIFERWIMPKRMIKQKIYKEHTLEEYLNDSFLQSEYDFADGEREYMQKTQLIDLDNFIQVSCASMKQIIILNHQLISRFKVTNSFAELVNKKQIWKSNYNQSYSNLKRVYNQSNSNLKRVYNQSNSNLKRFFK